MALRIGSRATHPLCARGATVALAIGLLLMPLARSASADASDPAFAQSLFNEGRRLMTEGKVAEACPKFAESQRLDPGGGTVLNLALCHEKEGRTASAWSEFNEALSLAIRDRRPERETLSRQHIADLEPKLSRLTVNVASRADKLEIKLDGVVLREAAWGSANPVDPGSHVVTANGPAKKPFNATVVLGAAEAKAVVVPALEDDPQAATVADANRVTPGLEPNGEPVAPTTTSSSGKTIGYLLIAGGVTGLGVGTIFGLQAVSKHRASTRECPGGSCTANGVSLNDQAMTAAWVSNIGLGIGIVSAGIGTYLVLTSHAPAADKRSARRLSVVPAGGPTSGGAMLSGTW
jgi:hypothetical protein